MSLLGSVPTTVNGAVRPSANVTVVCRRSAWGRRAAFGLAGDDVVVGQDQTVGGQDDAGTLFGLPAQVGLQLDDAGHHLGGDLLDGAGGRLAAGTLGAAVIESRRWLRAGRASRPARPRRRCPPTPPRSPVPRGQSACTRTLPRRLRRRHGLVGWWCCCGAPRYGSYGAAGRPAAAVALHIASRTAAAGSRCARADRDIPPCDHRRADGPAGAAAVSTSGGSSCRYGLFLECFRRVRHLYNEVRCSTVPGWAENPLREHSAHPQTSRRSFPTVYLLSALITGAVATSADRVAETSRPGSNT